MLVTPPSVTGNASARRVLVLHIRSGCAQPLYLAGVVSLVQLQIPMQIFLLLHSFTQVYACEDIKSMCGFLLNGWKHGMSPLVQVLPKCICKYVFL